MDAPNARDHPPPARLALCPPSFPPGPVCGAWWPRSDDLAVELPGLIEEFAPEKERVARVAAPRETWSAAPRELRVRGRTVRVARLVSGCDPHTIRLFSHNFRRWDLLVVPPDTAAATAARLMAAASDPANRLTASALVAAERSRVPPPDVPTPDPGQG
ncbi:DUF5994 family protein [Streptomyces sp. AN091965]|uniref:DUF5994 family protein n=1 Tax=Streptomyces sp. AN091965 TaxID=2927803 RepID=UPI001F616284|nr:DUF5994 family protein [Streptomyces sp. AN091965]MCI3928285.1 DUF5994 family protein [Streptomyces sp. AN091965]